ncbi:MAG: sugar transferase [Candidatus Krumholzibacteriota bacterium]|nr:sugar transferase [Candidatus Krumholzibacteriota bacterium]
MAGCPKLQQAEAGRREGDQSLKEFSLSKAEEKRLYRVTKRISDVIIAVAILLLVLPLIPVIIILIKIDTKGPLLFKQKRIGKDGREFNLYKFRSMVEGADNTVESLRQLSDSEGPIFKLKNDPRITSVGCFLRRSSLDELPQLINVLKGEMSIVGPRPNLPSEVAQYLSWQKKRLDVKPGITCFWQIAGRSHIGFHEWMRLDLQYIEKRGFRTDLMIILKTFPAVIERKGAY